MKMNGIKHIKCVPYHPSSNGVADIYLETQESYDSNKVLPLSQHVSNSLLMYLTTPPATINDIMPRRKICSRQALLRSEGERNVSHKQAQQKADHGKHASHESCTLVNQ
jgi:hypothetical protein